MPNTLNVTSLPSFKWTILKNQALLKTAKGSEGLGVVQCKDLHYLYVKIKDDFIHELYPLIKQRGIQKPHYFKDEVGAHISLIYATEKSHPIFKANHSIVFQVNEFFKAQLGNTVYFGVTVNSPEMIKIRADNGLKPLLNFKGFEVPLHVTLAVIKNPLYFKK